MTSDCLLVVLFFSEPRETMQCEVWKDEQTETESAASVLYFKIFWGGKLKLETAVSE